MSPQKIGWLVHNGALRTPSMEAVDRRLQQAADGLGVALYLLPNNGVLPILDGTGSRSLCLLTDLPKPDFVLFWDKDVVLAQHLEGMGYRLFNSSRAIALCDNKSRTFEALSGLHIPMPKTISAPKVFFQQSLSPAYLEAAGRILGFPMVFKECFGSFGMQVCVVENAAQLAKKVEEVERRPFLLQEYVSTSVGRDIRVNILGDTIVGAMERVSTSGDFRANIALGAVGTPITLTDAQARIALAAHKGLGLTFSGVDLLFGKDGQPLLCEVNSNVNFIGFESATNIDFARLLLEHMVRLV